MVKSEELAAALGGVAAGAVAGHADRYVHEQVLGESQYKRSLGWLTSVPVVVGAGLFETAAQTTGKSKWHFASLFGFGTAAGIVLSDLVNFLLQTGTPWERRDFFPPNHWIWKHYPANTPRDVLYKDYANRIADAIWRGKNQPEVRKLAETILADAKVDGRDQKAAVTAIQQWVQNNVNYVPDPKRTELFKEATRTLKDKAGDCDDESIVTASLAMSVGIPMGLAYITTKPFNAENPDFHHIVALHEADDGLHFVETIIKRMGYDEMVPYTGAMVIRIPDPSSARLEKPFSSAAISTPLPPGMAHPAPIGGTTGPFAPLKNFPPNMVYVGGVLSEDDLTGLA